MTDYIDSGPSLAIESIYVSIVSSSSVNLTWIPPPRESWNGILTSYTVIAHSHGPNNISSSEVMEIQLENTTLTESMSRKFPVEGNGWANNPDPRFIYTALVAEEVTMNALHEFFMYEFTVFVSNSIGDSGSVTSSIIHMPGTGT